MKFNRIITNFTTQNQLTTMYTLLNIPLFLGNIRGWQLIIIVLVIVLLFGGKKIPELMQGLGKGVQMFKKGMQEAKDELEKPADKVATDEQPKDKDK